MPPKDDVKKALETHDMAAAMKITSDFMSYIIEKNYDVLEWMEEGELGRDNSKNFVEDWTEFETAAKETAELLSVLSDYTLQKDGDFPDVVKKREYVKDILQHMVRECYSYHCYETCDELKGAIDRMILEVALIPLETIRKSRDKDDAIKKLGEQLGRLGLATPSKEPDTDPHGQGSSPAQGGGALENKGSQG